MALRPLDKSTNTPSNTNPVEDTRRDDRRRDRDDRDERRYEDEIDRDRDDLRESMSSIRQATANKFGERSNPTRALSALAKYVRTFVEAKARGRNQNYEVVIVDKNVACPSVVVLSRTDTKDGDNRPTTICVGHAIMLVDFSRQPEAIETIREGSMTFEEPTVWADAFDSDYIDEIETQIMDQLDGVENLLFIEAGCTTYNFPDLPVDQLLGEGSFQSSAIDNLAFTVLTAVEARRAQEADETDTALRPEMLSKRSKIVADINLSVNTSTTPSGLPIAEDFMIRVREVKDGDRRDNRRPTRRSLNRRNDDTEQYYGGVSGRIDFSYIEPEAAHLRDPRIEDAACHVPEFIIAGFDLYDRAPSLSMMLQLVSSVGTLYNRKPPIFLSAFKVENVMDTPSRNLGGLAMEVKDIKTDKYLDRIVFRENTTEETIRKFASAAIVDAARIGMEVPSQGPLTSLMNVFYDAAVYSVEDNEKFEIANSMLIEAADILTGGRFSEEWEDGRPVMAPEIANIPGGYWTDDHGQKRDSREMGYLFYANLANPKEALDMSREYADSFMEPNPIIAASTRRRLITEVKGTNFVQTDNFRRVYFEADFIETLNTCLRKCGLGVMTPNTNFGGRGDERRRRDAVSGLIAGDRLDRGYSRYSDRRDDDRVRYTRRGDTRSYRRR